MIDVSWSSPPGTHPTRGGKGIINLRWVMQAMIEVCEKETGVKWWDLMEPDRISFERMFKAGIEAVIAMHESGG